MEARSNLNDRIHSIKNITQKIESTKTPLQLAELRLKYAKLLLKCTDDEYQKLFPGENTIDQFKKVILNFINALTNKTYSKNSHSGLLEKKHYNDIFDYGVNELADMCRDLAKTQKAYALVPIEAKEKLKAVISDIEKQRREYFNPETKVYNLYKLKNDFSINKSDISLQDNYLTVRAWFPPINSKDKKEERAHISFKTKLTSYCGSLWKKTLYFPSEKYAGATVFHDYVSFWSMLSKGQSENKKLVKAQPVSYSLFQPAKHQRYLKELDQTLRETLLDIPPALINFIQEYSIATHPIDGMIAADTAFENRAPDLICTFYSMNTEKLWHQWYLKCHPIFVPESKSLSYEDRIYIGNKDSRPLVLASEMLLAGNTLSQKLFIAPLSERKPDIAHEVRLDNSIYVQNEAYYGFNRFIQVLINLKKAELVKHPETSQLFQSADTPITQLDDIGSQLYENTKIIEADPFVSRNQFTK
jgi:hypothetical protein